MFTNRATWPLAAIIALMLAVISIAASCTKNQRLSTIHASLVAVNTTRDEFAAWDLDHQRGLLASSSSREEVLAKIAAYEADPDRRKLIDGFELAYKALALAATQTDQATFDAAAEAVKALVDSFTKLRKDQTKGP
jgi:hypothetical protein